MEKIKNISCPCSGKGDLQERESAKKPTTLVQKGILIAVGIGIWFVVYRQLNALAGFITYDVFSISRGSHLGEALHFFLYDTPKVLMLLSLVIFGVGIIRTFFTPERTRKILAGKRESIGNVLAAVLGIVTPFCSCSAVPLFIGFVTAGVPLGVTLSFLISAPMVNEIALVLLYGLLGWKIAALYLFTGLLVAIAAGWIIGRLGMDNHIEDWVREMRTNADSVPDNTLTWHERLEAGRTAVVDIVGKVWIYVIAGIAVGAGIHGYVPEGFMASIMGKGAWWSVPAAVVIGVPMYSNAAGIVPVIQALLGKGAALGTVLAFMMSVIALSLPEMVILRKVLKPTMIGVFVAVVASGILLVGYLFNFII
jgi:uncharacterized protein